MSCYPNINTNITLEEFGFKRNFNNGTWCKSNILIKSYFVVLNERSFRVVYSMIETKEGVDKLLFEGDFTGLLESIKINRRENKFKTLIDG